MFRRRLAWIRIISAGQKTVGRHCICAWNFILPSCPLLLFQVQIALCALLLTLRKRLTIDFLRLFLLGIQAQIFACQRIGKRLDDLRFIVLGSQQRIERLARSI